MRSKPIFDQKRKRQRLLLPFLILFFTLLAFSVRAEDQVPEMTDKSYAVSDVEAAKIAERLVKLGQYDAARDFYMILLQSVQPEIRIEAVFQLSQIAMQQGSYDQAISYLLAILRKYPALTRVRLELARAYLFNRDYEDARFQFELVRGDPDLPLEVIQKTDQFLELIRKQKNWTLAGGLGIIPDTNINQVSGAREECIYVSGLGTLCRPLDGKESGIGLRMNAVGNYYLKLTKNFNIRNTLGLYFTDFSGSDYDEQTFYFASGPRYVFKSSEISLQPTYTRRRIAGVSYGESYGLRFDVQKDLLKRLSLNLGTSIDFNSYFNDNVDDALHGKRITASVLPRYILTSRSFIQAGFDCAKEDTKIKAYGNDHYRFALAGYYNFKYGFSLFSEISYSNTRYHGMRNFIMEDDTIRMKLRKDETYSFSTTLSSDIFSDKGIIPSIQYTYTKRSSNIWTYDFDRHRVNIGIDLRF